MSAGLPGWTDDELWRAALDGPRRAFVPMAGLEIIDRPGWLQLTAPAFREVGLNGIWHAALADDEADAVIDATIAGYAAHGLRFRWQTDPESRPLDLVDRLTRRGLDGERCKIMARATAGLDAAAEDVAADVTIERVDATSVATFDRVMGAGWELDAAPFVGYHRALLAAPAGTAALYLARWRGEPAASACHIRVGPAVCLMAGVVLPAARGRGLYRALVAARLRDAAAAGVALAVTLARSTTSAPILARLGFTTICDVISFRSA